MGRRIRAVIPGVGASLLVLTVAAGCHRPASGRADDRDDTENSSALEIAQTISVMENFDGEQVQGQSTATRALSTMRPECAGHIGDEPDVYIHVGQDRDLRLQASPVDDRNADLVMAVMSSSGTVLCSDDSDGLNPRIESAFAPGQYRVWIGAFEKDKTQTFQLDVTDVLAELPEGPPPTNIEGGSFGGLSVSADSGPGTLRGRGGGMREANTVGPGCVGFIGMRPDHVLQLESAMRLRVTARATDSDLVLLLQDSQGRVLCNDDSDGRNPALFEEMNAGVWNVYVGTFAPGRYPEYVLRVSR